MSKSVRRRSLRLENQFNDMSINVNSKTRSPKTVTSSQFKNSLLNRTKLDVKFSKVSKSKNDSNQRPYQSLFRNGSLFDHKDHSRTNSSKVQVLPNVSNSIQQIDRNRSSNISPSILAPIAEVPAAEIEPCKQDSFDSSSTFYEPDSTVDDDDLETDLLIDSNGPISSDVLIKNTKMNIPMYDKSSVKHKTGNETSQKNVSVKKLTQFKPVSVKTNTLRADKPVVVKKVKPAVQKKTQANSSQRSLFDEFESIQAECSTNRNTTKKNTSSSKAATLINEKVLPTKRPDLKKLSQHRLQTPTQCSSVINANSSNCKSKPKNSAQIRKNLSTSKPKSQQPKCVSPEIFASDYDSNQPNSSADMVLPTPSPPDLTKLDHSLSRNRLLTIQDTNSSLNTHVTNSTHHLEKTSRYPLRHTSSSSPVVYNLPMIQRRRPNSSLNFDNSSSQISTNVKFKSKAAAKKTAAPKPFTKAPLQFSQSSSVHESLLNVNTPQETLSDVYEFVSNSPKRQTKTKKKPRAPRSKSTSTTKTTYQCKQNGNNLLFSTLAAGESIKVPVSSRKKNTNPRTNGIGNPKSFAELTNNKTPKKVDTNLSKNGKNKERNFLNSPFSQHSQASSQLSSIFNTRNSQASQIFYNSNVSLNSPQTFFSRTPATSFQTHRNYNQAYGSMLAYIDSINHNNTDIEMEELCDLFNRLKISDERDRTMSSFLTYRDPYHAAEKSLRMRRIDAICKKPRKLSFFGNTFMNYRQSCNSAVEKNEIPFTPIPPKNSISNETNFRQFEYAGGAPVVSSNATNDTHLSAREILKGISTISTKLPHYIYADGEYNFDGFSNWN